jgi:hypothetical protein
MTDLAYRVVVAQNCELRVIGLSSAEEKACNPNYFVGTRYPTKQEAIRLLDKLNVAYMQSGLSPNNFSMFLSAIRHLYDNLGAHENH